MIDRTSNPNIIPAYTDADKKILRKRYDEDPKLSATLKTAHFKPWDDPPIGARVQWGESREGTILGVWKARLKPLHDCPDCTHKSKPSDDQGFGQWMVGIEAADRPGGSSFLAPCFQWPQHLRPIGSVP